MSLQEAYTPKYQNFCCVSYSHLSINSLYQVLLISSKSHELTRLMAILTNNPPATDGICCPGVSATQLLLVQYLAPRDRQQVPTVGTQRADTINIKWALKNALCVETVPERAGFLMAETLASDCVFTYFTVIPEIQLLGAFSLSVKWIFE